VLQEHLAVIQLLHVRHVVLRGSDRGGRVARLQFDVRIDFIDEVLDVVAQLPNISKVSTGDIL